MDFGGAVHQNRNMTYWAYLEIGPGFNRRWIDYLRSRLTEIEAALLLASSPGSRAGPDGQAPGHDPAPCDARHPGSAAHC
jgi:hypothetical protein